MSYILDGLKALRPRVPAFLWPILEPQGLRWHKSFSVDLPLDLWLECYHCGCDWPVTHHRQLGSCLMSPREESRVLIWVLLVTLSLAEWGTRLSPSPDQHVSQKHPSFSTNVTDPSGTENLMRNLSQPFLGDLPGYKSQGEQGLVPWSPQVQRGGIWYSISGQLYSWSCRLLMRRFL